VFSFQIDSAVVANDQYAAYADYLWCLFFQADSASTLAFLSPRKLPANTSAELTGVPPLQCSLEQHISFPLWFIVVFNEAAQGLMVFFIFGTSWRLFKGWYNLFTNPRAIWSNSESGSSTGSGGAGGSSTSLRKIQGKRVTRSSAGASEMVDELDNSINRDDDTTSSSSSASDNENANEENDKAGSDDDKGGDQTDVEMSEMSEN